jgi:hypothetical protein
MGVTFRLFAREFSLTWRELSNLLGFPTNAALDLDIGLEDFDRHKFWSEISRDFIFYQPRTSDMEHPTLRFLYKWMSFAFFPRQDPCKIRIGDLQLIYAAVKKKPVSPVRLLVAHWQAIPSFTVGAVGCCSIVTRIVDQLNLLDGTYLTFIEEHRPIIGYDHFSQARMLKRENDVPYMVL